MDKVHQKGGHNGVLGRVGFLGIFFFSFLISLFLSIGRWAEAEADEDGNGVWRQSRLPLPPSHRLVAHKTDEARLRGPCLSCFTSLRGLVLLVTARCRGIITGLETRISPYHYFCFLLVLLVDFGQGKLGERGRVGGAVTAENDL